MSLHGPPDRRVRRVLIVVNVDWYFWSHRLALARGLRASGFDVTVVAGEERGFRSRIEAEGFRFVPLRITRGSTNPIRELRTLFHLRRIYRRERPDVVHHVSIKPILYGSLAARFAGRPAIINAVTGLGHAFLPGVRQSPVGRISSALYRIACSGARTIVLCQNPEDCAALVALKAVSPERTALIRGSGVDMAAFTPSPLPFDPPLLLFCSRVLWDKGPREFVEAARLLRAAGVRHRAVIVGIPDEQNPNSVPVATLEGWHREGVIEWWGLRDDMPEVFAQSTVVVLPSYYPEGVPKVLIEAAAAGRPLVTTDTPGCREIARAGINADYVRPRDSQHLADTLRALLDDPQRLTSYGAAGRGIAVAEFSEEQVITATLRLYDRLLPGRVPAAG